MAIAPIDRTTSTVQLTLTVTDAESDSVGLRAELIRGGATPVSITLEPAEVASSPDGEAVDVQWDAAAHFGSTAFVDLLFISITPFDDVNEGIAESSAVFAFGNDAPAADGIVVDDPAGGIITITLDAIDSSSDALTLTGFALSTTGQPADAQAIPVDTVTFPGSDSTLAASPLGTPQTITWNSSATAPYHAAGAVVTLTLTDLFEGTSVAAASAPFELDNRPTVEIAPVSATSGARFVRTVAADFVVDDPNAPPVGTDTASVSFEFALTDSPQLPSVTWFPAEVHSSSEPLTTITDLGVSHTFVWDLTADAAAGVAGLSAVARDTGVSEIIPTYVEAVSLRAIATADDASGLTSLSAYAGPFAVGDDPPVLDLLQPESPAEGLVALAFEITDSSDDPCQVQVEFRLKSDGLWRPADITQGSLTDLLPSSGGVTRQHVVVWNTRADPSGLAQGVGGALVYDTDVQVRAASTADGVTPVWGDWSERTIAEIRNQNAPRVELVGIGRLSATAGTAPVPITYRLFDEESDPTDLHCEYQHDGGAWQTCDEYRHPRSEGRYDLLTAPTRPDGLGGVVHTFFWDATGTQWSRPEDTVLRLTASDGNLSPSPPLIVQFATPVGVPTTSVAEPFVLGSALPSECSPPLAAGCDPSPRHVAGGDFDADGLLDLAWSDAANDLILVSLNNGDGSFSAPTPSAYQVGDQHVALATAQVDSNATLDLLIVSAGTDEVQVLLGNGDGTFSVGSNSGVGGGTDVFLYASWSLRVAFGYFNDDSNLDLALPGNESDTVEILIGDGAGSFSQPNGGLTAGVRPLAVVAADFDQDAISDLAVANWWDDTVYIFLGTGGAVGDGGFVAASPDRYWVGDFPHDLVASDLNDDDHVDLIVTNSASHTVSVLMGRGDGTFDDAQAYFTEIGGRFLAVDDFDGNGIDDLVIAGTVDAFSGEYGAFMPGEGAAGKGTGGFGVPRLLPGGDQQSSNVITGDFNLDGLPDVVFPYVVAPDEIRVLEAQPTVAVALDAFSTSDAYPNNYDPHQVRLADVDDDGALDVVVVGLDPGGNWNGVVSILPGLQVNGLGQGNLDTALELTDARRAFGAGVADLDGDGLLDLVLADNDPDDPLPPGLDPVWVHLGDGNGAFAPGVPYAAGLQPEAVEVADVNGDGIPDAVVVDAANFNVQVMLGLPAPNRGELGAPTDFSFAAGTFRDLFVADLDADGNLDVALATGNVRVMWGDGTGALGTPPGVDHAVGGDTAHRLTSADINLDGIRDIVVGGVAGVSILYGTGSNGVSDRGFVLANATAVGTFGCVFDCPLAVLDANGDGWTDIVAYADGGWQIIPVLGVEAGGEPLFGAPVVFDVPGDPIAPVVADLNQDGVLDIISASTEPVAGSAGSAVVALGQYDGFRAWIGVLQPWGSAEPGEPRLVGIPERRADLDRFNAPYLRSHLSLRRSWIVTDRAREFLPALRAEGPSAPATLVPLTDSWWVGGVTTLARVPSPEIDGVASAGLRLRPQAALGDRTTPGSATDFTLTGLDLSDPSFAQQRGVAFSLPIHGWNTDDTIENVALSVRVYRATSDWVRADAIADDPLVGSTEGEDFLPRVPVPGTDPVVYRDLFRQVLVWEELTRDDDFEAGTETGARFAVTLTPVQHRRVEVLTNEQGYFQAFLEMP